MLKMISNSNWATACEIKAASNILECEINVWLTRRSADKIFYTKNSFFPSSSPSSPVVNLLLENNHFQVLVKKERPISHSLFPTKQTNNTLDENSSTKSFNSTGIPDNDTHMLNQQNKNQNSDKILDSTQQNGSLTYAEALKSNLQTEHHDHTYTSGNAQIDQHSRKNYTTDNTYSQIKQSSAGINNTKSRDHSNKRKQSNNDTCSVDSTCSFAKSKKTNHKRQKRSFSNNIINDHTYSTSHNMHKRKKGDKSTHSSNKQTKNPQQQQFLNISIQNLNDASEGEHDEEYVRENNLSETTRDKSMNKIDTIQTQKNNEKKSYEPHSELNIEQNKSTTTLQCESNSENFVRVNRDSERNDNTAAGSIDSNYLACRKVGVEFEKAPEQETPDDKRKRNRRNQYKIKKQLKDLGLNLDEIPDPPPITNDEQFNKAMDSIRSFELKQMSYTVNTCSICHETRINMKLSENGVCINCKKDKYDIKMFSDQNNMNPGKLPQELNDLTIIEQQLICRISPCINVHLLKHGGIGSSGHCVTFPQDINEPAQIFPRLPKEINIIKVCRQGKNNTSKTFRVRRYKIQNALIWLKRNNPAYVDIIISQERLNELPIDGDIDIPTIECNENTTCNNDRGPAPDQTELSVETDVETASSVLLPDPTVKIADKIQNVVNEIIENNENSKKSNSKVPTISWPTRDNEPVSEFTTKYFFTLAFPCLFPYGLGDFYINRPRTCISMSDWADHLLWYEDGRFAKHQYFKFVIHNMIMRKKAMETSNFVYNQQLGDGHLTIDMLKEQIQNGDTSAGKKILYFGSSIRGTNQYWNQRARELRSLIQYKINDGKGLPSFFTTGSCAEFYFKPLRRLLGMYVEKVRGESIDLSDKNALFSILQEYPHVVSHYFDLRTQSYFKEIMGPVFGVDSYWYRQEFAKSRGMIHWHGLCWRTDREPHNLLHEATTEGLSEDECATRLAEWASSQFGLTACHPAGRDQEGNPKKNFWPPPEGTAPPPSDDSNPLIKLLMDVSSSQESLLEDHLLLSNRFNLHRCSSYCLNTTNSRQNPICRMEFPKQERSAPAIVKDRNRSMRLELERDHPALVQHSKFHTQGWRANGDISLILSKSDPENPSVNEILATEKYITGYACKGNQPTGAIADLFNDMVSTSSDCNSAKSLCTRLLMSTVKRDISAVEACHELSSIPLYRSSHTFQSVSLSGFRVLERDGSLLTRNTSLDKYLGREKDESVSFYTFLCKSGKVPVITGGNTQVSWPLEENYCKTSLILHFPNWFTLSDIKNPDTSWVDAFNSFLESESCPNFLKAEVERAKQHNDRDEIDEHEDRNSQCSETEQPDWMENIRPDANFENESIDDFNYDDGGPNYDWGSKSYNYPLDKIKSFSDTMLQSLMERNSTLDIQNVDLEHMNDDQQFAFNIVMKTMVDFKENEDKTKPLRMIVSGTAGSGKSYLIKCLVKAIRLMFKSNKAVQVLCPTGNSANLISGVTLHSFLKIPTTGKGKEMKFPDGSTGEQLQSNCKGVKVLLVDERSLIGANTLGWMDFMCRCGMCGGLNFDKSWGGIPVVVFFGDDVQLPPVLDIPVYKSNGSSPATIHGLLVWKEFQYAVHLKNIVRQGQHEQVFRDALLALRTYSLSNQQAIWLQQFQWRDLQNIYGNQFMQQISDEGLYVFPTHSEVWQHNKLNLIRANEKHPIARLKAECHGPHSKGVESDKAGGLLDELFLCRNAKVMLSVNLCVPFGLFNGAIGYIVDIIYENQRKPADGLPDVVMVNFPNYTGPSFVSGNNKIVPILPVSRKIDCRCFSCKRTQIPLKLGWATTIHKCQGMTIGQGEVNRYIVINPGTRLFESRNPGALFVALSRAKSTGAVEGTFPDFAWHPSILVNQDRLCHVVKTKTTEDRCKEISRIQAICTKTEQTFQFLRNVNTYIEIINSIGVNE
ncbi:hypothetical protein FSP39_007268 [Pinctada imbricata]|uniref:ATP-dependent DNA helicase n=1 Tax=Pinctada imbricata TaxID=66713 RepID=A0AA88YSG1_PINIB|nr:hypothetical protein FSP39_007268 [Pinctada imbricata]